MDNIINFLFYTGNWPPRWYCGKWSDALGYTHIVSDLGIFAAYFAIPCILLYFTIKLKGIKLERIFFLFALFILMCGGIHLIEAIIFYYPVYRFSGLWKALTAVVSLATAVALVPYVKKFITMPKLEIINKELMDELEIERERIETALDKLVQNHKTLEEFSHRVAHDLKQPIRGVYSYSTILLDQEENDAPETKMKLEKIKKLTVQSMKMIDDLLEYCMIEEKATEKQVINALQLFNSIQEEIPDPQQEIVINIQPDYPDLFGNPVIIKEAIRNLIMNGIKYNDKPQKTIDLKYEYRENQPIYIVQDNGDGIPEKHLDQLFDSTAKPKRHRNSGTGLGLKIVKKIIDQHGGEIWVESKEGLGTTIYFTLPV